MKHWSLMSQDERKVAILDLRDAGNLKGAICEALGVTSDALGGFCQRHHITGVVVRLPRDGRWYSLTTKTKIAELKRLDAEGKILSEIADELETTSFTIRNFCWEHGVLGLSEQRIAIKRPGVHAMVPDEREIAPDAWTPLGPPVSLEANTGCSWPVEGGFCGHPKHKRSYCEDHYARAYPARASVDLTGYARFANGHAPGKPSGVSNYVDGKKQVWRHEE